MKKYLSAGIVILLPIALTTIIVLFFVNLLTTPFLAIVTGFVNNTGLFKSPLLIDLIAKLSILLLLFFSVCLVGFLGRLVILKYFLSASDRLFRMLPFVNKIYNSLTEMTQTVFGDRSQSFSKVVLVPYPSKEKKALGFVVGSEIDLKRETLNETMVPVLIIAAPTPNGIMLFYKKQELIEIDMSADEAFKCNISCGLTLERLNPASLK